MDPNAPNPDQLRDIQGFQPIVIPTWLWVILGVIIFSLVVWFLYKYVFKPKPKPELSLFERVLILLKDLNLDIDSKNFYLSYSEIVRIYLEERLNISLLDKTAEEIKPILMSETRINTSGAMSLAQIFARADLAKFARQEFSKATKEDDISHTIQVLTGIEDFVKVEEQKALIDQEGESVKS